MFEFEKPKIEIVEISDDNKYVCPSSWLCSW